MVECSICLEEITLKDVKLNRCCNNVFHKSCIKKWNARSGFCPLCRKENKVNPFCSFFDCIPIFWNR